MKKYSKIICSITYLIIVFSQNWRESPVRISENVKGLNSTTDSIFVLLNKDNRVFGKDTFVLPIDESGNFKFELDSLKLNLAIDISSCKPIKKCVLVVHY